MADTVSVTQAEKDERLGEALFAMSAQLKASGFLADSAHHSVYERVVAAFNLPVASTQPTPTFPMEEVAREARALRDALLWYRDNAAMCRKIGSIGEPARKALDADGGKRADEVMDNSPVLAALLQGKQP